MNRITSKYYLIFLSVSILILTLTSCLGNKTVIRNYEFYNEDSCDCVTTHPLIVVGSTSSYFSKEKATCTRTNFITRKDSISILQDLRFQLCEQSDNCDSTDLKTTNIDSMINDLKKDWTHLKIKTKWKGTGDTSDVLIIKQKIKYFNKFKLYKRYIGLAKYKNGQLIKSKMKNVHNTK